MHARRKVSEGLQVETNKDKQLQRRVQSLQRFLMTRLKAELAQRAPAQPPDQGKPNPEGGKITDAGTPATSALPELHFSGLPSLYVDTQLPVQRLRQTSCQPATLQCSAGLRDIQQPSLCTLVRPYIDCHCAIRR